MKRWCSTRRRRQALKRLNQLEKEEEETKRMQKELDERCKHDWVTIETVTTDSLLEDNAKIKNFYPGYLDASYSGYYTITLKDALKHWNTFGIRLHSTVARTVCIECGECHDGIKWMRKEIQAQIDKRINAVQIKEDRLDLAKKMWKSCEKGVK